MLGVGRAGPRGVVGTALEERRTEAECVAVLLAVNGIGPVSFAALVGLFGSARAVIEAAAAPHGERRLLERWLGAGLERHAFDLELARRIGDAALRADEILAPIRAAGLDLLTLDDPRYPPRLLAIELPPPLLFVRGRVDALEAEPAVAVVGTRRPTESGRWIAARIAGELARAGATVVSGLARGIDGVAHAAVVERGARTVAVLGGGHERLFPRMHLRLADEIVATGGAIVSEQPPLVRPEPWSFPRRNRIIAGLSEATVVVEAGIRSGALTTAAWALEQGRACFLVPGSIDAPTSQGCLAFLRECPGEARVVAGVPELLEDLGLVDGVGLPALAGGSRLRHARPTGPSAAAVLATLGETAARVAGAVANGLATADEIVADTALPIGVVLAAITLLEDRGLVVGAYGRYRPSGGLSPDARAPRRSGEATPPAA